MIANPHRQAHLQFTKANPQSKNFKRACLSATAFLPTQKTNFFGNGSSSIGKIYGCKRLIISKAQYAIKLYTPAVASTAY